ncbi:MAG: hypothetical protein CVU38_08350 [Chloroflexi bacterium HGW-Chloroflexi-1]|nr:MAG: hypothetical protein CVU38_08350 [Chloroflexi bacterium HGW-Chloroflexi-1]
MRTLLSLLLLPVLLLGCAVATLWIPLPRPFPAAASHARQLVAAVLTGLVGITYLIGLTRLLISRTRRGGRFLDAVLGPLGFTTARYLALGRQYHGLIRGRQVTIDYMPGYRLKLALLNIYVSAPLGFRAAIGRRRPLLDCRDCPAIDLAEPGLSQIQAFTHDAARVRGLFAVSASREAIRCLLSDPQTLGPRALYLQPDRVWLAAHLRQATEEQLRGCLADLVALAEAAEDAGSEKL